jgi:SAM-dependent methyltransferase
MTRTLTAYSLETGAADGDRLGILNHFYNPGSRRFLRQVGAREPHVRNVLEVGCGQGQMAHFLAREGCRVVGIDLSEAQLAIARSTAPAGSACTFVCTSADQLDALGGPFDLIYSRFLLQHVPDPVAVLNAMAAQLAPGGTLAVEDALVSAFRAIPEATLPEPSQDWWYALGDAIGASYRFPESLPQAVRELGLEFVYFDSHQPVTFDVAAVQMQLLGMDQIAGAYLKYGIADAQQIARARAHLRGLQDEVSAGRSYVELYRALQVAVRRA